jgi:hypothetical protein
MANRIENNSLPSNWANFYVDHLPSNFGGQMDNGYDIVDSPLNPSDWYSESGPAFDPVAFMGMFSPDEMRLFEDILALIGVAIQLDAEGGGTREVPSPETRRPEGDRRSAEQIINDSPVARDLGHQKDIKREELKKQVGDWENDPDPKKRADAAYRLVEVLEYIDNMHSADGEDRGDVAGDGDIQGITKDGDARHGTEAGMLKDFAEQGYAIFDGTHGLHTTNDSHVRSNGTNKDNFQWFMGEVGDALSFLPGISNVLRAIGESHNGPAGVFLAGLAGLGQTFLGGLEGLKDGIVSGDLDPISLVFDIYNGMTP